MKKFVQVILFIIVVYNVLAFLMSLLDVDESGDYDYTNIDPTCDEFLKVVNEQDHFHQRSWYSAKLGDRFCMNYESYWDVSEQEMEKRDGLIYRISDYENFWGEVYFELINQSDGIMDFMADSLIRVGGERQLSELELASIVVSFVQDIPYSYVLPEECSERETYGKPCLGNVPLGIVSPYEFAHHLQGDCDTRAVLLFVILEKMGYDPMIVVSDEYAHAMLALNIPAQGDYLRYAGKKYYFWETTATGWGIGMLPPDTNNKNYWRMALVNKSNS